jgi:hypothetical protein
MAAFSSSSSCVSENTAGFFAGGGPLDPALTSFGRSPQVSTTHFDPVYQNK